MVWQQNTCWQKIWSFLRNKNKNKNSEEYNFKRLKMEVLEVQSVDADCTVDHFTAVADIVIRRPHVIRSRMKLVAGAKIISQEPIVLTDKEYTEFVNNIQKDFLDGKVDFPDQDFSQQELDYSQSSQIHRRIVYKGNDAKESDECVLWIRDSDSRVSLHILPLGIVENSDNFIHCKAHFCVSFDSALHQVIRRSRGLRVI